ncbi:MAG TPA: hypothetical protein EYO58_08605, partial [Flavobacteriales bacterium]|nr:hypothetical protein [Flavobacteriales bacterium]
MTTPKSLRQQQRPPTPRYPSKMKLEPSTSKSIESPKNCEMIESTNNVVSRPQLVRPKEEPIRVAFCGKICSGKTTLAQHLQHFCRTRNIEVRRIAFGDYVKSIATEYFQMKEKDRTLLVQLGTSMRAIDEDVWVNCVKNTIKQSNHQHWIVDDLRYENEYNMLKELGFKIIRLDISREEQIERIRGVYPTTYEEHLNANEHSSEQQIVNREKY